LGSDGDELLIAAGRSRISVSKIRPGRGGKLAAADAGVALGARFGS
jgi:hypothetical protein